MESSLEGWRGFEGEGGRILGVWKVWFGVVIVGFCNNIKSFLFEFEHLRMRI